MSQLVSVLPAGRWISLQTMNWYAPPVPAGPPERLATRSRYLNRSLTGIGRYRGSVGPVTGPHVERKSRKPAGAGARVQLDCRIRADSCAQRATGQRTDVIAVETIQARGSLVSRRTYRTLRARITDRSSIASRTLRTSGTGRTLRTSRTGKSRSSDRAHRAYWTDFTGNSLRTLRALLSWIAGRSWDIPCQLDLMRLTLEVDSRDFAASGYAKSDQWWSPRGKSISRSRDTRYKDRGR